MDKHIVIVHGLPSTCNHAKLKLRFQTACKVPIKAIRLEAESVKVELESEEDSKIFRDNLPDSISFGSGKYSLKVQDDKPQSDSSNAENASSGIKTSAPSWKADKIYAWSDLEQPLSCERGIIVQPSSISIAPADIWEYFEDSQQSCGGPIGAMFPMLDGIFLWFKDDKLAEKVWNCRPHRIKEKPVVVYMKTVPPTYSHKLVVMSEDRGMTEDHLKVKLKNCSSKGVAPKGVKKHLNGRILVVYDEKSLEKQDILNIMQEFKRKNSSDFIALLRKPDCLQIQPYPKGFSELEIRAVFENKNRTSDGCVTAIAHSDNSLFVHHSSYEDAESAFEKYKGKTLPLFGVAMKVRCHHPILLSRTNVLLSNMKDYYDMWLMKQDLLESASAEPQEKPLVLQAVSEDICSFLSRNKNAMSDLNAKLNGVADAKIMQQEIQIFFKRQGDSKNQYAAREMIVKFLSNYSTEKVNVEDADMRRIVDRKIRTLTNEDNVCLRWTDNLKTECIVTGVKTEVDSVVRTLKPVARSDVLWVNEGKLRWLIEMGVFLILQKQYPSISEQKRDEIKFVGSQSEITEARRAIQERLETINCARFISQEKKFVEFLASAETNPRIKASVFQIMEHEKMKSILTILNGYPHIVGPEETNAAAEMKLKAALAVDDSLKLDPAELEVTQPQEWVLVKRFESEGKLLLQSQAGKNLCIVGFREYVDQAVEKLLKCTKKDCVEFFPMKNGYSQYVTTFDERFTTFCSKNSISATVYDTGIQLKGEKSRFVQATRLLESCQKTIIQKTAVMRKPGASEFLKSRDGQDLLSNTAVKYRSAILTLPKQSDRSNVETTSRWANSSITFGRVKVSVRHGDLTEEMSDIILNSIGPSFKLYLSEVSKAIERKGGPSIQEELNKQSFNDFRVTKSGKLRCKNIIHVCFPNDLKRISECLIKVFKEADKLGARSISLPAIGTGAGVHDIRNIAAMMVETFRRLPTHHTLNHLTEAYIVILDKQQMMKFQDSFLASDLGSVPGKDALFHSATHISRSRQMLTIGNLTVSVKQGDITEESNTAIVNSTSRNFDLSYGQVSKAILKKGGESLQKKVQSAKGQYIRVTDGGKLKCREIIHAVAPTFSSEIGKWITMVLDRAEADQCTSLSIPAVGTGNLGFSLFQVARTVLTAIQNFAASSRQITYLRKIDIVIFDPKQVQEFQSAFFTTNPIQAQSDTNGFFSDEVEIQVFSASETRAEMVLNYVKDKVCEALRCIVRDDRIDTLSPTEEGKLRSCESQFGVKIIRSRGQLAIEGPIREDVQKAREMITGVLKALSQSDFIWEYKDNDQWHPFEASTCEQLEEYYKKFLDNVPGYHYPFVTVASSRQMADFKSMMLGSSTFIRRNPSQVKTYAGALSSSHGNRSQNYDNCPDGKYGSDLSGTRNEVSSSTVYGNSSGHRA